jgi:hypothetical protein
MVEAESLEITFDELSFYLGLLISVDHIKKYVTTPWQRVHLTQYYNTIYRYSHKKMFMLSNNKVFRYLF